MMIGKYPRFISALVLGASVLGMSGSVGSAQDSAAPSTNAPQQGLPPLPAGAQPGYLAVDALPDSLLLLPPPPKPGSPGFARDEAIRVSAHALKGTHRWSQAISDADL
jgi:acid phosphatase (class A)